MKKVLVIGLSLSLMIACSNPAPKEMAVQEEVNAIDNENEVVKADVEDESDTSTIDTVQTSDEKPIEEKPEPAAPVEKAETVQKAETVEKAPEVKSDYLKNGNKGIGPIKSFEEKPFDQALANRGNQIFITSCAICHDIDQVKLGPALAKVTKRRTPEWILNMILNPVEMLEKDPDAIALKGSYAALMIDMGLKEDEARAVLEYLRKEDTK